MAVQGCGSGTRSRELWRSVEVRLPHPGELKRGATGSSGASSSLSALRHSKKSRRPLVRRCSSRESTAASTTSKSGTGRGPAVTSVEGDGAGSTRRGAADSVLCSSSSRPNARMSLAIAALAAKSAVALGGGGRWRWRWCADRRRAVLIASGSISAREARGVVEVHSGQQGRPNTGPSYVQGYRLGANLRQGVGKNSLVDNRRRQVAPREPGTTGRALRWRRGAARGRFSRGRRSGDL